MKNRSLLIGYEVVDVGCELTANFLPQDLLKLILFITHMKTANNLGQP
jgi:hypothetical protein